MDCRQPLTPMHFFLPPEEVHKTADPEKNAIVGQICKLMSHRVESLVVSFNKSSIIYKYAQFGDFI